MTIQISVGNLRTYGYKACIQLASQAKWTEVADGIHIAESAYQAQDWKKPRRIIMVRQEIDKRPKAAGKKIKKIKPHKQTELFPDVAELGNYRYSCFITSLTLPAKAVYDLYRGRADSENRIKEIKYDFSGDPMGVGRDGIPELGP